MNFIKERLSFEKELKKADKAFKKNKTPLKIRLKIFFSPCRWCRKIKKIDARVCCPRCKISE